MRSQIIEEPEHFLETSVARLPLMSTDFKSDPARLAELKSVVDQLTDLDPEENQVELLQSIRLLLGVIAHRQLEILERMSQEDSNH